MPLPEVPMDPHYTYEEAAALCLRSPGRVKHVVTQRKLPRSLVRCYNHRGRGYWRILLPASTVRLVRLQLLGL